MAEENAGAQRRSFYRVAQWLRVRVRFPQLARSVWYETATLDFSGGGVAIPWRHPLPRGTRAEIEIVLPDEPVVRSEAKVAFSRPETTLLGWHRVGLELVNILDAEQSRIVRLVMDAQRRYRG